MTPNDLRDRGALLEPIQTGTWDDYLQTLHRYFFEHHGSRCLVWVNPAQGDPFADLALEDERKNVVPISHPRFDRKFGPYLIDLQLDKFSDAEIFKLSVEMAWEAWSTPSLNARAGQPICGWIGVDGSPKELIKHWARCHLHPVGNRQKFLRFHDPGVRELLWTFLSPTQKAILTANTSAIFSVGRQRKLLKQTLSEMRPGFGSPAPSLVLDAIQWNYVADFANIHAAFVLPHTESGTSFNDLPVGMSIFKALEHATRYGVLDESNRQLFIRHVMEAGSAFHQDDRLKKVWALTQSGAFYGTALQDVLGCEPDQFKNYLLQHFA